MRTRCRGFSLLELILVIGIIGLLLSLLLPALAPARRSAITVRRLADGRSLAVGVTMYGDDNGGFFPRPFGAQPNPLNPIDVYTRLSGEPSRIAYFRANAFYWPTALDDPQLHRIALYDTTFELEPEDERLLAAEGLARLSRYAMTSTVHAAPEFFVGREPGIDPVFFRAMRISDVLYPAQKLLLTDFAGYDEASEMYPVMNVDHSARLRELWWMEELDDPRRRCCLMLPMQGGYTEHGVRGVDFE
ncbi:MAG: type II secretion system protein [Planctomycetota bacterium]